MLLRNLVLLWFVSFPLLSMQSLENAPSVASPATKIYPKGMLEPKTLARVIYQGEGAFLSPDSPYDYVFSSNLNPCAALIFSFNGKHLFIHRDNLTDIPSIKDLLASMGVTTETIANLQCVIYSKRMDVYQYIIEGHSKEYLASSHEGELNRLIGIFVTDFGIPVQNIVLSLDANNEFSVAINKNGEIFQISEVENNFYQVENWERLNPYGKRQAMSKKFQEGSKLRVRNAFSHLIGMNPDEIAKVKYLTHMSLTDIPNKEWPTIGHECFNQSCFNPGEQVCSKCKKAHYCSRACQLKDWPRHKGTCK